MKKFDIHNIRSKKRAHEVALNFCAQNQLENFKIVELSYITEFDLKNCAWLGKEKFLYYAIRNIAYDMVDYLITKGCVLTENDYRRLIISGISSKYLVKLYDLLKHFGLVNNTIFGLLISKLNNREYYGDLEYIFIREYGKFTYSLLKIKLDELGISIKENNKFLYRQLLLEEILEN